MAKMLRLFVLLPFILGGGGMSTPAAEAAQLSVAWTDNASDEEGFHLERRRRNQTAFAQVASLTANVTAFVDRGLPAGSEYCYRVRAFNTAGPSSYTDEACGAAGERAAPLWVGLTENSYSRSQTLEARINALAGEVTTPVDAYVVVQTDYGKYFSLQVDGRLVPGVVPITRSMVLPTLSVPFRFRLSDVRPGNYTWMAGLMSPGTFTSVSPVTSTPFTVVP